MVDHRFAFAFAVAFAVNRNPTGAFDIISELRE